MAELQEETDRKSPHAVASLSVTRGQFIADFAQVCTLRRAFSPVPGPQGGEKLMHVTAAEAEALGSAHAQVQNNFL